MHTVTLEEIQSAMKTEIVLASSCNTRTKKAKNLKFYPAELKYRVRFYDGKAETSNSYFDPLRAIEKYNSYDT